MAKPFQKQKAKTAKETGNYAFTNFSEGLYQLETPRGLPEQLGSLALIDGRNVFTERGALIPQYGYLEKAQIPTSEVIVGVTEDSKSSSSVFILCMSGNIYYYSSYDGLKKYKTTTEFLSEDTIYTRMNNNVVICNGGNTFAFGSYFKESEYVEIIPNATVGNFSSYVLIDVPVKYSDYFWRGKVIAIPDIGAFTVNSIKTASTLAYVGFNLSVLDIAANWVIEGSIVADSSNQSVVIDKASGTKVYVTSKVIEGNETTTIEKIVTKYQCYKYTIDKSNKYAKLFATFAKQIPTSGYYYTSGDANLKSVLYFYDDGSKKCPTGSQPNNTNYSFYVNKSLFKLQAGVQSMSGNSANKYGFRFLSPNKTTEYEVAGSLSRDSSGDIKETITETVPTGTSQTVYKVSFNIPFADGTTGTFEIDNLQGGQYTWQIENNTATGTMYFRVLSGSTIIYEGTTTAKQLKAVADNPEGLTPDGIKYIDSKIGEAINTKPVGIVTMTATPYNSETDLSLLNTNVSSIGEQTLLPISLVYTPEDAALEKINIKPVLLGSATNRLLIYDVSGAIFYSSVGILDDFTEAGGAGYFKDFYNDTSECLSIEDYLSGCLITKQNGLYYVVISDSYSTASVASENTSGLRIQKVAEIGQEYAGDHVIVSDIVYAFDSNSGSIVIGCYQNVYGNVVSGQTLVPSEYVGSVDLGITEQRRKLVYSSESEVFILYYGSAYNKGLVLTKAGSLFPRELNKNMFEFVRFNQGIMSVAIDGTISQDFKRGTIVPELTPIASFEPIGLMGSNLLISSIIEVVELNGIEYDLSVTNTGTSVQHIKPYVNLGVDNIELPPLLYSDKDRLNESFGTLPNEESLSLKELKMVRNITKWANKRSNLTRIYAPASGRDGVRLTFEFQPNVAFCLAGIRLADFSKGE